MNIGSLGGVPPGGVLSSAAGSQLQQTRGKDVEFPEGDATGGKLRCPVRESQPEL